MNDDEAYILDNLIDIRFADPINAIQFINDYIIIGTMTGAIILYDIQNKVKTLLKESNKEEISSISYNEKENIFYIAIGDLEILKYTINTESQFQKLNLNLYESESKHKKNCENAFIFLSQESVFRIQLDNFVTFPRIIDDDNEHEYELKYFNQTINNNSTSNEQPQSISGKLKMSNYSVPFDFDGNNFLYIEFLSNGNRKICVKNISLISDKKISFEKELDKNNEIGHISFAKLLDNKTIFIIHSLNKCEIRLLIDEFKIIESFENIGEEVYAFDIFYENNDNDNDEYYNCLLNCKENQYEYNATIENKKCEIFENNTTFQNSRKILKINSLGKETEELHLNLNSKNKISKINKINKENKESNSKKINIITLDINGNVNLYKKGKEITLFNMYELNTISQDYKDKQFFSLGYAYHIKTNLNYFCISTDHGCFLIKKNNI